MNENANVRPTSEAKGYLDTLTHNSTFSTMIDAYAFAAAFAMRTDLDPESDSLRGRSDLVAVRVLDNEVRLALECSIAAIRKHKGLEALIDSAAVLEQVTRYAEVGLRALKQRWDGKTSPQILYDIKNLLADG